ncbi:hypothetical protein BSR03_27240, partial [Serratia proteamaculans]
NLGEIADRGDTAQQAARDNLELGTAAVANVGTNTGNVMAVGAFGLGRGSSHKDDAYNNIGEIYRVNNTSASSPTTGVAGVVSLPCDGGPSTGYIAVSYAGAIWSGHSDSPENGVTWYRVYTTVYKPTAEDVGALPITGGNVTGTLTAPVLAARNATTSKRLSLDVQGSAVNDVSMSVFSDGTHQKLDYADTQGWLVSLWRNIADGSVSLQVNGTMNADVINEAGQRVYSPNNPQPIDLSSYVQGIRKGARVSLGSTQDITTDDGYIDDFHFASQPDDSHIWQVGYSPLQYLVNGTWLTLYFGAFELSAREIKPVPEGITRLQDFNVHRHTLVDANGYEWYAASEKIQGKYFVGYFDNGVIVVSDTDASMLFPRGMSVAGVDSLPKGFKPDGENWVFDGTRVVPRIYTTAETVARNRREFNRRVTKARHAAWPLECAVSTGEATHAQQATLLDIQRYVVNLQAVDLAEGPAAWPTPPATLSLQEDA